MRKRKEADFLNLPPIKLSKPKKTRTEINHDYYKNLKKDPSKYTPRLERQREISKKNRDESMANPEKKASSNEKTADRMRKYRQRMKENGQQSKKQKVMTRKDAELHEKKRENDKLRKRAERANWSHQKRKAESLKASKRYELKKSSKVKEKEYNAPQIDNPRKPTKAARYKALSRAIAGLPKNLEARQQTVIDLCKKYKVTTWEPIPLFRNDRKLNRELIKKLHVLKNREVYKRLKNAFGLSKSRISYWGKKKLGKKVSKKQEAVIQFFKENCRVIPGKRGEKQVLEEPIEELFQKFKTTNNAQVSKSFFFKHRPTLIKKMADMKFNQSLCEVCENFRLICKSLAQHEPLFLRSKHGIINNFLCTKEGTFHQQTCIERTCNDCEHLDLTTFDNKLQLKIQTEQWLYKQTEKGVKRKVLVQEEKMLRECLEIFKQQMKTMPKHLFTAQWQYTMFLQQQKTVKPGQLMTVMDFAENYRCVNQDEVQAAYWNYKQATVHPMVNYYKCDTCGEVVTATVVAISDDLTHDSHAVEIFIRENIKHLRSSVTNLQELVQWSDGCGVQYKSKQPFASLQTAPQRYCVSSVTRNFYGSRHGKNPSDGVNAHVKNKATRAVLCRRAIIQNARDLFIFLERNMTSIVSCETHTSRHFVYVSSDEIKRTAAACITLKGTRMVHSIKARNGRKISYRNLTCICAGCEIATKCENSHWVNKWMMANMLLVSLL